MTILAESVRSALPWLKGQFDELGDLWLAIMAEVNPGARTAG